MSENKKTNSHARTVSFKKDDTGKRILVTLALVLLNIGAVFGLYAIEFVSDLFAIILMEFAICVGAFKIGRIWQSGKSKF